MLWHREAHYLVLSEFDDLLKPLVFSVGPGAPEATAIYIDEITLNRLMGDLDESERPVYPSSA